MSKLRNYILIIFIFLDVKFGFIYQKKIVKGSMIDLIRPFMIAIKVLTNTGYMIFIVVKFLSPEIYILIKFNVKTIKI